MTLFMGGLWKSEESFKERYNSEWPIVLRGDMVAVRSAIDGLWSILRGREVLTSGHEMNSDAWNAVSGEQ
jgi:hypothetical protein